MFVGSMLIPRVDIVPMLAFAHWSIPVAAPFVLFTQEPTIYVEQPGDDRDMPAGAHAPGQL